MTVVAVAPTWWRRRLRLFNAMVVIGGVVLLPVALVALALKREWRIGMSERFGHLPVTPPEQAAIWIHGASVGELTALAPIVHMLRRELPDHRLVLSSMTVGGLTAARTRVPDADVRVLFPLDLPAMVERAVDRVRPCLVLFSETELWPNFLAALATHRIPAIMVSGRLSPRAFARYRRWRWLFAPALVGVRWFCVQSLESARRLVALGAPTARVIVTGSLKTAGPLDSLDTGMTLASLGVGGEPVLLAASTHAGEDEVMLEAFARIRVSEPRALLVLAPRKPERAADIAELIKGRGFTVAHRSTLGAGTAALWPRDTAVLLLDTLGELAGLYRGARLAFVGGTLVPIGGHNVLEPAAVGTAVVVGPETANVHADIERLIANGGGLQARDSEELAARMVALFVNPVEAAAVGARALTTVAEQQGALVVTSAIIRGTLRAQTVACARTDT